MALHAMWVVKGQLASPLNKRWDLLFLKRGVTKHVLAG